MPIDLGNGKNVLSMKLIDVGTGKEVSLFEREGSRCHFYDDIEFDGYIITLRIDWGDIRNSDPVMDADVYINNSCAKGKKIRYGKWHHTAKNFDEIENKKLYEFSFGDLKLRLGAKMTFSLSVGIDAKIVKKEQSESKA